MRWSAAFSIFLLSFLFLAIATNGLKHDNYRAYARDVERRQDDASATNEEPTPTETPESSSSSETPTPTTSEGEEETPTPTTTSTSTSSSSSSSKEEPTVTTPEDPESTASDEDPAPTTSEEEDKPTKPTSSSFVIITKTITSGNSVIPQEETSYLPAPTSEPGLGEDEETQESSGLSTQTRNIIIGVVVGVGGAIILGGLAVVYYRLRRKRNARGPGDDDDLMHAGTAVGSHSHENSNASSPFKSTLDQYHNPGPVNPASNF